VSLEKNQRLAERWFLEMWSKPDPGLADEIIAAEYAPEWVQIDAKGPEQVKHEIRYFRSVFPDLRYEIVDLVSKEDCVWVRYKAHGTQKGKAWGFESSGRRVDFEGVTILYINSEGLVCDRWGAFCFYDILADLELVPSLWDLAQALGSNSA
jgi:hypothetical protein